MRGSAGVRVWVWTVMLAVLSSGLLGCDQLGIETPETLAQRRLAEAKAIGAACRHAERAIEDCYILNAKAEKASVFEGWREMDEYMRENKMEGVAPVVPRPGAAQAGPAAAASTSALGADAESAPASAAQ